MNKINELIQALCPEGVEWKMIGDVVKKTKNIRWADNDGEFRYIDLSSVDRTTHFIVAPQIIDSETAPSRAQQIVHKGDVIFGTTRPSLRRYAVIPQEYDGQVCSTGFCVLRPDQNSILTNFLFHLLGTDSFYQYIESNEQGTSYPAISDGAIKKFPIPIPPLPIQNEIVHILDLFTKLEAELEAELEARKMQYTYYRDALLNFEGKEVEWKTLGEVGQLRAGKSISTYEISSTKNQEHLYPCIGGNGLRGYVKSFSHAGEYPVIGRQGALCGNLFFARDKFYATEHAVVVSSRETVIPRFLFFLLISLNLNQYATGGAQPGLAVSKLVQIKIPIPPLAEQARIVTILDQFDTLVNDLSSGLPAEIKARRQQYEYYRNQLLTFKNRDHG